MLCIFEWMEYNNGTAYLEFDGWKKSITFFQKLRPDIFTYSQYIREYLFYCALLNVAYVNIFSSLRKGVTL